ncbi:hypothetical protein ABZ912_53295 [Nonomuraea angiospora]|uniref:hypothetical protein n=1 Tax=Nonomuraea angiospora TaxID=46172 RepID=UPI00340CA208
MPSRRGTEPSRAAMDLARRQGAAPELMYVVDLPGYELAEQSVGVINDDGFGAVYTSPDGKRVELRIDRGPYAVLKRAAQGARPATGTGPPAPSPPAPAERGDLPRNGDAAPIQRRRPGG